MIIETDKDGRTVHHYTHSNAGEPARDHLYGIRHDLDFTALMFQHGPLAGGMTNGITNENVLAVLIHRLGMLQGKKASPRNVEALDHLKAALKSLQDREAEVSTNDS